LAREAIERLVDFDDWFVREVEKGLAQIELGQTLGHDEVDRRVQARLS
jgi:predicted transcriptional regulator